MYEAVFESIFLEIKDVMVKSKEVTFDLGVIGKLKLKDRKVDFQPIERQKNIPLAINMKATVRSLIKKEEKPRVLPKLSEIKPMTPKETQDKNKSRLVESFLRHEPGSVQQGGATLSIVSKISNTFR